MRAYAADRFGELSELTARDLPVPEPKPSQLLVRVKAAALNPADLKVLAHKDGGSFLHASKFPLIPGFDFSGVVERVGTSPGGHAVDDEIFGFLPYARSTRGGTLAEYVVVDATAVGRKPRSVSHEHAAAAATAGATALQVIRDLGRFAGKGTVLINGASGGVGSYAVQIAKLLGARVVATASAPKLDHVRGLGADRAVDYKTTKLADLGERFSVIFDAAATSSYGECAPLLEPGGTYVTTLPSLGLVLGLARAALSSRRCKMVVAKPIARDLDQLATWLDEGKLVPAVDHVYPFAELHAAFERLKSGDARGKIAVTI